MNQGLLWMLLRHNSEDEVNAQTNYFGSAELWKNLCSVSGGSGFAYLYFRTGKEQEKLPQEIQ